jgi:CheY-like chemotaxis protein
VLPDAPFHHHRSDEDRGLELARLQQRAYALEHEVAERQRIELALHRARQELQAHSRRLADALQSKEEILSLLGHELRNPLAPILTAIELLETRGEAAPEHAVIARHVRHLHHLIEDLLDVGRLARNKPTPTPRPLGMTPSPVMAAAKAAPAVAAARRRVLVVDDNEDAASLLADLLGAFGQQAEVAHRAQEALEVARRFEPEVALLDIGLPGVDGLALARQLRLLQSNVRLVAVTGYGDAANRALTTDAGFEAHLVKPVQIGDVLKLLA